VTCNEIPDAVLIDAGGYLPYWGYGFGDRANPDRVA
jgi:hypothetical protein